MGAHEKIPIWWALTIRELAIQFYPLMLTLKLNRMHIESFVIFVIAQISAFYSSKLECSSNWILP